MIEKQNQATKGNQPDFNAFAALSYRPGRDVAAAVNRRELTPDRRTVLIRFAILNANLEVGDLCRNYLVQARDPSTRFLGLLEGLRPANGESGAYLREFAGSVRDSQRGLRLADSIASFMIDSERAYGPGTRMMAEALRTELRSQIQSPIRGAGARPISTEFALTLRGLCFHDQEAIAELSKLPGMLPLAAATAFMATVDAGKKPDPTIGALLITTTPTLCKAAEQRKIVTGAARKLLLSEEIGAAGVERQLRTLIDRIS